MTAGKYDITIEQGATFYKVLTWTDSTGSAIDLSGYTARMHIRQKVTDVSPILNLTTENSRITLGGSAGTITLLVAAIDTAVLSPQITGYYDLEVVSGTGVVTRLVEGRIFISPEITR